jgi:hypothetical protein
MPDLLGSQLSESAAVPGRTPIGETVRDE